MTEKKRMLMLAAIYHAKTLGIFNTEFTIRVNFIKGLNKLQGIMGECGPDGHKVIGLNIDPDFPLYVLQNIIAHEMVHAKQWIRGELSVKGDFMRWNGKKVSSKLAYHETPWEREAMASEVMMAHGFIHFLNGMKK